MPIGVVNVRLLTVSQDSYKSVPGCRDRSSTYTRLIYPDDITTTPEELLEEFKLVSPEAFEETEILDGTTISNETHHKAFNAFREWLETKGFRPFYLVEKELPVLEIPAQVTLISLRPNRFRR